MSDLKGTEQIECGAERLCKTSPVGDTRTPYYSGREKGTPSWPGWKTGELQGARPWGLARRSWSSSPVAGNQHCAGQEGLGDQRGKLRGQSVQGPEEGRRGGLTNPLGKTRLGGTTQREERLERWQSAARQQPGSETAWGVCGVASMES